MLVADIPTQILLITNEFSYQRETIDNKIEKFCKVSRAIKVKKVSKIWFGMSISNTYLN